MVKLFSRTLVLLVLVGQGTLLGMQDAQSQAGKRSVEAQQQAEYAQQQAEYAQQQKLIVQAKNAKKAERLENLELDSKLKKAIIESDELDEKLAENANKKRDREVNDRAKVFKGLLYGLAVPGTVLINYNTGNFGINQFGGLVMLVVLTYYGVIHAFLVYLSEGVQHIKQIPLGKAIDYVRRGRGNESVGKKDLLLQAFESDSDSE